MARIRSLKPEFWLDRKLARSLSRDARMLYLGLWNQADEHARAQADPRLVKGQVFPFDDDITDDDITVMLKDLEAAGVVQLYDADGDPYLYLPKLGKHQRLEPHKVDSKYPAPPEPAPDQPTPVRADESARDADESARDADESALLYVAGSMEHGAGTRGADESAPSPPPPKSSRRKPSRPLPDDFTITDAMRAWHRERDLADDDVDRETERFKRDAQAKDRRYADWSQAWRNWIDRAVQWQHLQPRVPAKAGPPLPPWELS